MKGKKKIRRRKSGAKMYFDATTQESIQLYQTLEKEKENQKEKVAQAKEKEQKAVYSEHIMPAFNKLAENLIFVYGFISPQDDYATLKNDCVTFLYETINKWSPERGTKAFSYFNVVAKNWLIMNSRKSKKRASRTVSLSDITNLSIEERRCLMNYDFVAPPDELLIQRGLRDEILKILEKIQGKIKGVKELSCIEAIITVFKNIDQLDFLNKRAIFIYVRDISGLTPKQLSVAMSSIRKHYRGIIKEKIAMEESI